MKWGEVKVNDVFITRHSLYADFNDVWVVIGVTVDKERSNFVVIRYVYVHDMGNENSESKFSVSAEAVVDYDPMFNI